MNIALLTAIAARSGQAPVTSSTATVTSGAAPSLPSAFTALLTLAAPRARVFAELADVENLPRWAGGFCEKVYLVRGGWAALTSLGELYLTVEADETRGEITLWAGWSHRDLLPLPLQIAETPDGETTVKFSVPQARDEDHARLCRALCGEWPGLFARLDRIGVLGAAWRSN